MDWRKVHGTDREGHTHAEYKYTPAMQTLVWLFDHSSCHKAYAPDALNSRRTNVRPGGAQPAMRDTEWAGRPQKLVDENGVPKGWFSRSVVSTRSACLRLT